MNQNYSQAFKIQAVEKVLLRADNVTIKEVANVLGVDVSSLNRWRIEAKQHTLNATSTKENPLLTQEKRPQDWTLEERFNMVLRCAALEGEALSEYCREQGIYPHHVAQWKVDFVSGNTEHNKPVSRTEIKNLKHENNVLKKELNRKDKALAETAALLVLQKKVHEIWGSDEDS
jgi:transposase-like protein